MSQPELYVMVGLPGSGKDYWINLFMNSRNPQDYYIASTDAIIEEYAKSVGKTYSEVFDEKVKSATSQMNREVSEAIKARKSVIWNQTNMAPGKRKKILSQFPKEYRRWAINVVVDDEIHQKRLRDRAELTGKHIPDFVIKNMRETYVAPDYDEGFDDVILVRNN